MNANLNLSDRVRRGPDWKWGCQDIMGPATWSNLSGATWAQSHISTLCLRVLRRVGVRVKWDQGGSSRYRTEKAGGADLVKATVRNPAGCHPSGHVVRRKGSPEPRSLRGRRGVSVRQLQYCVLFTFKRRAPVTAPRGTRLARYIRVFYIFRRRSQHLSFATRSRPHRLPEHVEALSPNRRWDGRNHPSDAAYAARI